MRSKASLLQMLVARGLVDPAYAAPTKELDCMPKLVYE